MDETWFVTYLVDDLAVGSGGGGMDNSRKGGAGATAESLDDDEDKGWEVASDEASMTFHVTTADVTETSCVPRSDVKLRIEHRYVDRDTGDKRTLFLHNSEEGKPKPRPTLTSTKAAAAAAAAAGDGGRVKSFGLVFSSNRSVQDIFKMMIATREEADDVHTVQSFLAPVHSYAQAVSRHILSPSEANSAFIAEQDFKVVVRLFSSVIGMLIKGDFEFDEVSNYIDKRVNKR